MCLKKTFLFVTEIELFSEGSSSQCRYSEENKIPDLHWNKNVAVSFQKVVGLMPKSWDLGRNGGSRLIILICPGTQGGKGFFSAGKWLLSPLFTSFLDSIRSIWLLRKCLLRAWSLGGLCDVSGNKLCQLIIVRSRLTTFLQSSGFFPSLWGCLSNNPQKRSLIVSFATWKPFFRQPLSVQSVRNSFPLFSLVKVEIEFPYTLSFCALGFNLSSFFFFPSFQHFMTWAIFYNM